jgi:hypothetical protein
MLAYDLPFQGHQYWKLEVGKAKFCHEVKKRKRKKKTLSRRHVDA